MEDIRCPNCDDLIDITHNPSNCLKCGYLLSFGKQRQAEKKAEKAQRANDHVFSFVSLGLFFLIALLLGSLADYLQPPFSRETIFTSVVSLSVLLTTALSYLLFRFDKNP